MADLLQTKAARPHAPPAMPQTIRVHNHARPVTARLLKSNAAAPTSSRSRGHPWVRGQPWPPSPDGASMRAAP
eukprot:5872211-Prymnesium_polylepis.1